MGTFFPKNKLCNLVKNQHFCHKKMIPRYSTAFQLSNHLDLQKLTKCNFTATAKFRQNRFRNSNAPKHAQNWLFLGIFSFCLFLRSIFWELWTPNLLFNSSIVKWNTPNVRYMPQVYKKTELSNLTKNEIVFPTKHGTVGKFRGWGQIIGL